MSSFESCLNCSRYITCQDKKKSFSYLCDKYKPVNKQEIAEQLAYSDKKIPKNVDKLMEDSEIYSEFNISRIVNQVLDDKSIVPIDIRINDRDIPKAKNFYEFATGEEFLNIKPFLWQLLVATIVNAEYCARCSDLDWMFYDHKVTDSLRKFEKKVALLENGECPHCGITKSKLVAKSKINFYQEMAIVAGQRCVVGNTLVLTDDGIVEIGDYVGNRPYGFSNLNVNFHTGEGKHNANKFYRASPERCKRLVTKLGFSVIGTNDHPVMTLDGFKRLETIEFGEYVRIYYGQNVFGNKNVILKDVTEVVDLKFKEWYDGLAPRHKRIVKVPRRKPGCGKLNIYELNTDIARLLGYWVAEGRHRGISNNDQNVLNDCYNTLVKMFGDNVIRLGKQGIEFTNAYVWMWLSEFMNVNLFGKSAKKEVPRIILQSSKEIQVAFLSALFEGDGGIGKKKDKNRYTVGYASISKKLIDQLSVMLLNIGIPHRRRTRKTWATNGSSKQVEKNCYCLGFAGTSLQTFAKEIGFQSERKNSLLEKAVYFNNNKTNNVPHYYEKLPIPMHLEFLSVIDEVRIYLNNLSSRGKTGPVGLHTIYDTYEHRSSTRHDRKRTATKADIISYIKPLINSGYLLEPNLNARLNVLVDYAESNYYYDVVVCNNYTKNEYETYDVTIPGSHRFISNGLLSHNSGKSAVTAMMTAYLIHRVAKLNKPNEVYGLLHSNILHGTFCALSFGMAKDLLYDPLYGYLIDSPWFINYHALLEDHQRKTGESIFKLNDTFLMYRHRALVVAPVGPDRRTLRGKTRMFACIPGDALINTSNGLVRMDAIQVGDTACFGPSAEITKHECTGVKELYKLRLESGQELECSKEHKIATYVDGKIKKVKLSNFTLDDKVVFTLGGKFPEELIINSPFPESKYLDRQSELYYQISNLKSFTLSELEKINTMTRASIIVYVNKLIREGHVSKTRLGDYKEGDRFTYTITDTYSYEEQVKGRNEGHYEKKHQVQYPDHMSVELAYILGYLVADGDNDKRGLRFKCKSKKRRDHFVQCVEAAFGVTPNTFEHEDTSTTGERTHYYVATIVYKKWIEYFLHVGLTLCYSADKIVPWSILEAPKECVIAFLQALVECDGNFGYKFTYNTISSKLALQVQQLILKLGVPCHITKTKALRCKWKYGNRKLYHNHVGVASEHCEPLFNLFKGRLAISKIYYRYSNASTKSRIMKICGNMYYAKVESIVYTGRKTKVYDMTVKHDYHVYQANGILVSNSVDELGHFDNTIGNDKVKMNANEVYIALERSLLTIRASSTRLLAKGFNDIPTGYFLNISSPFSVRDKIMELLRASINSTKIYGLQKPTWELNPTVTYEDLKSEFDKDEVTAWRDYGAQPPLQSNAFITQEEAVQECIGKRVNGIKLSMQQKRYKNGESERYAKVTNISQNSNPSILALDAGHTNNSFGFVCGHMKEEKFVATIIAEVMPLPGIPLNFTLIYENVIKEIIESQNVQLVTADRWNSIKILSDIRQEFEIATEQYSLKYKDMWFAKNYITESQVTFPRIEKTVKECIEYDIDNYPYVYDGKPVEHLILQMLTVRDTGNAVVKGDGNMTDDIFRALCLAIHRIKDDKWAEIFNAEYEEDSKFNPGHLAVVKGGSSNATVSSISINGTSGRPIAVARRSKQ